MPEAAATSSIEVAANPARANAVAAPRRIEAARSARGSSTRGTAGVGGTTCQVYTREYTPVVTSSQMDWSEHELLESHRYAEPLYAGGIRCHGGFDDDGRYVSPRTRNRVPAIEAWEEARATAYGIPGPIISTLTRIGTVEGFGGFIRTLPIPNLSRCFDEDVRGTAMAHLERGLYEAHARDEAGFEGEGGHKDMWFAARDVAFEHPVDDDQVLEMLQRMGFTRPGSSSGA